MPFVKPTKGKPGRGWRRRAGTGEDVLASFLGPLEHRVLESIWARGIGTTVRDLEDSFPDVAYTTLMTTLDRLHKKGVLDRSKSGRAYVYWPRFNRAGLRSFLAEDTFEVILGGAGTTAEAKPLLSSFVDAVSRQDRFLLDELDRLVQEKRRKSTPEKKR